MAIYRVVIGRVHVGGRLREVGEEITFAGEPGVSLMPLDAAANAAKLQAVLLSEAAGSHSGTSRGTVTPARLGGNHRHRIRLARSLGAGELPTYQDYSSYISTWIATQRAAQEV